MSKVVHSGIALDIASISMLTHSMHLMLHFVTEPGLEATYYLPTCGHYSDRGRNQSLGIICFVQCFSSISISGTCK